MAYWTGRQMRRDPGYQHPASCRECEKFPIHKEAVPIKRRELASATSAGLNGNEDVMFQAFMGFTK